jgi:hypothetical protein
MISISQFLLMVLACAFQLRRFGLQKSFGLFEAVALPNRTFCSFFTHRVFLFGLNPRVC